MFCRACWANIPDDSTQCPRCHGDARTTPPTPARRPAAAGREPSPGSKLSRLAKLNLLLAGLIVTLAFGPPLLTRYAEWTAPRPERPPGPPPGPATSPVPPEGAASSRPRPETSQLSQLPPLPPLPPLDVTPPPPAAPSAAAPTEGGDVALAREAAALFRSGRIAEACERYRELAGRVRSDDSRRSLAACLARLGREAYQADQTVQAALHYQQALEAYPAAPEIWAALAITHVKSGAFGRAEGVTREALSRFPDAPDLLYLLAETQERQGKTRDAAETLRRLLAAHPGHARGRSLLATLEREQKVEGGYWAQESRHFLVRYEGAAGIDLGRSVVDVLEEAYDAIGNELGILPRDRVQVGIYAARVFGDVIGAPPHLIAGAYDGRKIRLNLAASAAYSQSLSRLIRHEYTHALIHLATSGRAPIWLHEGLAQVMEPRRAPRFLDVSVPREYLTLSGIERLARTASPEALVAGYSLTHVAVEHLVERGGMASMRTFLQRLGQGEPVPQAMRQAFGLGPEDVEARLLAVAGRS